MTTIQMEITSNSIKLLPVKPTDRFIRSWYAHHGDWQEYSKVYYHGSIYDSPDEELCVAHGCYFYLNFAIWCKDNFKDSTNRILKAISAKLIMNNDLSYVRDDVYCIWYPDQPSEETCIKLLKDYPHLKYQVARVCVEYSYNELFKTLDILPEEGLLSIVESKRNRELKRYIKSQKKQHKQKLWRVLNDTNGMLTEPRLVKSRNMLECEVLSIEALKSMYCDEDKEIEIRITNPVLDLDILSTDADYYDPLQTGALSFISAKQKMRQLLS